MILHESTASQLTQFKNSKELFFLAKEDFNGSLTDYIPARPAPKVEDGIGHVYVQGSLFLNGSNFDKLFGTDYTDIQNELETVISQGAAAIVLHLDSGGGTVNGAIECAEFIEALNVPVITYTASVACSAAYKLAAACTAIVATKSATLGNIGSLCVVVDDSAMLEGAGIKVIALASEGADLKTTGYGFSESQLSFLQAGINESGASFKEFVLRNRPEVAEEVFRAGWYSGTASLSLGLIDAIGNEATAIAAAQSFLTSPDLVNA